MGQFRFNLTHYLDVSPVLRVLNGMVRSLIIAASLLIATSVFALSPSCVTITSVTPSSGPPGTHVVVTGTGFASCCPFECTVPSVTFDGTAAQVVSWTDTQLVVIAPSHEGLGAGGFLPVTPNFGSALGAYTRSPFPGAPAPRADTAWKDSGSLLSVGAL